jgi:hypothetical protein
MLHRSWPPNLWTVVLALYALQAVALLVLGWLRGP